MKQGPGRWYNQVGHTHFIWMHHQHSLPVYLLHLLCCYQVCHANWFPLGLPSPQHGVHGGEKCSDISLFAFNPFQNLQTQGIKKWKCFTVYKVSGNPSHYNSIEVHGAPCVLQAASSAWNASPPPLPSFAFRLTLHHPFKSLLRGFILFTFENLNSFFSAPLQR